MRQRSLSRATSLASIRADEVVRINLDEDEDEEIVTRPGLACRFRTPGPSAGEPETRDSGLYTYEDAADQIENLSFD